MSEKKKNRKQTIQTILLFTALISIAVLLQGVLIFSDMKIDGLVLCQKGMAIHAEWKDEAASIYKVTLSSEDKSVKKEFRCTENQCDIPIETVPYDYTVTVVSKANVKKLRLFPQTATGTIHAEKIKQNISANQAQYILLDNEKSEIGAKAISKVEYSDYDRKIISVNENGRIKAKKPGKTTILLYAPGGSYYNETRGRITVSVYPDKLKTPKAKISKETGIKATITWKKVPYAEKYIIYRSDKSGKLKKLKSVTGTSYKVIQKADTYRVRAAYTIKDRRIKSPLSDAITVRPYTDKAKTYKKAHTIAILDRSKFNEIASISGTGSAIVPQSFSYSDGKYVVSFSSRTGNKGAFVTYDMFGKKLGIVEAETSIMNGSIYNSNTKKIYTVHTHMKSKSKKCSVFDPKTLIQDEVKLPRITSGIAYDESINKYYLSGGPKVLITNDRFKGKKCIKKVRYMAAQDIGAGDGIVLVCVWTGSSNYIDIYREKDKKYLGGYTVPFGELESVLSVNKHLVLLMHNTSFNGTRSGKILITKKQYKIS